MTSAIYKIENMRNGKKYFGQSKNVERRWKEHIRKLRGGYHENDHLQSSWNIYGEDAFSFEIVKACKPRYLDRFEKLQIYLNKTMDRDYGYNLESGGHENKEVCDETRAKQSAAKIGKPRSQEVKKKISEANSGENNPCYGRCGEKHPMYGQLRSQEEKMKISESNSKTKNSSGFYRVSKHKDKACKQGFRWIYEYRDENKKRKTIYNVDLSKLMLKVTLKDLAWKIVDIDKAMNTINEINKQKEMI